MRRVFLAALYHETHGFVDDATPEAAFRARRGEAVLGRAGDGSTLCGFLDVARREGWQVVPSLDAGATPSGPVEHAAFEGFAAEIEGALRAALPVDAIFLCLHGAMATTAEEDCEGALLARLRAVPGAERLPLFGVFDLHATFTDAMARHADGLVAYRANPHTDARESSVRAAEMLARSLRDGTRPRMMNRVLPIVWPPTGTGTADDPMRALEAEARALERGGVLALNVVAGFAFADARDAGVSMSAAYVPGSEREAAAALDRLAASAWDLRASGLPREHDLDEAVRAALAAPRGPVLLVEPADNIGGGAPGDCTGVLRALLRHQAPSAAVALNDPAAVAALAGGEIGGAATPALGGKGWRGDAGPVVLPVTLVSRSDGRFTLEDRRSHLASMAGVHVDMGPSAVVRHGGITILLTTRKTPPFDLGQWRSQGVEPTRLHVIGVKAAVAHRRAYDPIAAASWTVATRGPCASDLAQVPYRRIRRPVFPLDQSL